MSSNLHKCGEQNWVIRENPVRAWIMLDAHIRAAQSD